MEFGSGIHERIQLCTEALTTILGWETPMQAHFQVEGDLCSMIAYVQNLYSILKAK